MKYVQINAYSGGWAPSVIFKKHEELMREGHQSYIFWARGHHQEDDHLIKFENQLEVCLDALFTRFDGKAGFHSKRATKRLLQHLDEINPDVVHLHVLLGYYINIEMLFNWLFTHHCKVIWTLHDCWAFTGHCIHFSYVGCSQWKNGCCNNGECCPQEKEYPQSWFGCDVHWNYLKKRELFTLIPNDRMRLITPSHWLAELVKQSFLNQYEVDVIPNTVDSTIFHKVPSTFKERYGLEGTISILAVASKWSERKGLNDLITLCSELDERFSIVIIGLSKNQINSIERASNSTNKTKLVALPRTDTIQDLVEIYSGCDLFFNPTKEDNFPTVNLEAEACGLPVVTYDTGGCMETVSLPDSYVAKNYFDAKKQILVYSERFK